MMEGSMTDNKVKLQVLNLTKRFGDLLVLDDVTFYVRSGEFVCIVGPTGCGKTTFLNSITKLYTPSSGEILLDGEPVDPAKHKIAYIFQEESTMDWLTVAQNVEFGLKIRKMPEKLRKEKVAEYLEIVGLQDFHDYYPRELSSSMLQRVSIARAFVTEPDLLLMDEPYGQLDIELRFKLEDELIKLWKKTGTTVLFITHNIEEAVYLGENIMILTNKPAKIKEKLPVHLEHPRNIADPEFVNIRNRVTELIRWW